MRLPLFPLHAVLFPHLPLPIHVFEPRYRALARDVMGERSGFGGRFVVSMLTDGREVGDPTAVTQRVGTICEVRSAEQMADGRWMLLTVGLTRARIGSVDRSGEYTVAEVEPMPDVDGDLDPALLASVQSALDSYVETVKRFVASVASSSHDPHETSTVSASLDDVLKPIRLPDDASAASYAVAGLLQIELTRKQALLEAPDAATRLRTELHLLRRESRLLAEGSLSPIAAADLGSHPN